MTACHSEPLLSAGPDEALASCSRDKKVVSVHTCGKKYLCVAVEDHCCLACMVLK